MPRTSMRVASCETSPEYGFVPFSTAAANGFDASASGFRAGPLRLHASGELRLRTVWFASAGRRRQPPANMTNSLSRTTAVDRCASPVAGSRIRCQQATPTFIEIAPLLVDWNPAPRSFPRRRRPDAAQPRSWHAQEAEMSVEDDHLARAVEALDALGEFEHPWMRGAFAWIPRHRFVPDTVWIPDVGGGYRPLERSTEPQRWAEAVYAPHAPLVVQVDDGRPALAGIGREASSSISAPSAVLFMLRALDVRPGDRVLEIGSGTGWNAALLCERAGPGRVCTVEIDLDLADRARAMLEAAGCRVDVVCGDGELGHRDHAPFERVIATAAVGRVPHAWIEQSVPGGVIVAPRIVPFHQGGLLRLVVAEDGTAAGSFDGGVMFMPTRSQRHPRFDPATLIDDAAWERSAEDATALNVAALDDVHARFATSLRVPDVHHLLEPDRGQGRTLWLSDAAGTSWAVVRDTTDGGEVNRSGPRDLAQEVHDALVLWEKAQQPRLWDFRAIVTRHGTTYRVGDTDELFAQDPSPPSR